MSVKLVFPPQWIPMSPPVSTAMLTAHLRSAGIDAEQIDLNARAYSELLDADRLAQCWCDARERARSGRFNTLFDHPIEEYRLAEHYAPFVIDRIAQAKRYVSDKAGLDDPGEFMSQYRVLLLALRLVSLAREAESITFTDYASALSPNRTSDILQAIERPRENLFAWALMACADEIASDAPTIAGISIISSSQLIPGLILASQIKQRRPDTHVVLGGAALTYMSQSLRAHGKQLFDHFDSIVLFDGERPLEALHRALCAGAPLDGVPNLMRRVDNRVVVSKETVSTDVATLPVPNYDGIRFADYLSRELVLSMVGFSKGCYWNKCTFCFETLWHRGGYVPRDASAIAHEMTTLRDRHGVRHFDLVDLAVPAVLLKRLGSHLDQTHEEVYWSAYAKSQDQFPADCFETAYRGGCRQMLLGVESGSDRVLGLMAKGATREAMLRYLGRASEAGLWNHGFLMFGFPTETSAEALETFEFARLLRDRTCLHSMSSSTFALCVQTPVFESPARFGIKDVRLASGEIGFECSYTTSAGLDLEGVAALDRRFKEEFPFHVDLPSILTLLSTNDAAIVRARVAQV